MKKNMEIAAAEESLKAAELGYSQSRYKGCSVIDESDV
jgi:hypothetical protein